MQQFPNVRQPALGIQDAAMLPAQAAGNLLIQRLASAEAAFIPTTETFDSTTSSTALNSTVASSQGGSLRSLMIPIDTANFVPIVQQPSPVFLNGTQLSQFSNQQLVAAIVASQTRQGSAAGRAILNASGIDFPGSGCGCTCTRELSEEVVIDEGNTNGIIDEDDVVLAATAAKAAAAQTEPVAAQTSAASAVPATMPVAAAETANVQYVTYNA